MTKNKGIFRRPYRRDGICPRCGERPRVINYCQPCATAIGWQIRHGMEPDEYQRMVDGQGGGCAVCGRVPSPKPNGKRRVLRLAVDHDHVTGRIRGLLCSNCNTALGLLQDDPVLISSLGDYRRRFDE